MSDCLHLRAERRFDFHDQICPDCGKNVWYCWACKRGHADAPVDKSMPKEQLQ